MGFIVGPFLFLNEWRDPLSISKYDFYHRLVNVDISVRSTRGDGMKRREKLCRGLLSRCSLFELA